VRAGEREAARGLGARRAANLRQRVREPCRLCLAGDGRVLRRGRTDRRSRR
jgi:hypothetical protein